MQREALLEETDRYLAEPFEEIGMPSEAEMDKARRFAQSIKRDLAEADDDSSNAPTES